MKLVQKILSHGLLITFFIAVFFLYLYRQSLFPQWFGNESRNAAQQTTSQPQDRTSLARPGSEAQDQTSFAQSGSESVVAGDAMNNAGAELPPPAPVGQQASQDDTLPPVISDTTPAQEPPEEAGVQEADDTQAMQGGAEDTLAPTDQTAAASTGADAEPALQYRPMEQAAESEPQPPVAAQPKYRPLEAPVEQTATQDATGQASQPAPEQAPAVAADTEHEAPPVYRPEQPRKEPPAPYPSQRPQPGATATASAAPAGSAESTPPAAGGQAAEQADSGFRAGLAQARETFWNGDIRGAFAAYRNLVESYPQQADGWGELGNLYLTAGQRPMAAEAFYNATRLLIDQGETIRARHVLRMLHGLDADKAGELEERLRQVGG